MSSDSDDERRYRPKKKKGTKIPKLGEKIVIIKNKEKDSGWGENWDKPKNRSPGHLPHPFRLLALGGVGRGKTNSIKNLFLKHQTGKRKFKKLIVITCSEDSREYDDLDPDCVLTQIPDLGIFDGKEKTMVILDDYETMKMSSEQTKRLCTLMRFISSHRNVSCVIGYQSFFDCPSICRKVANCFLLYKPNGHMELTQIANRCGIEKKMMKLLFKNYIQKTHDSLFVDKTPGTPYPLRRNIYEVIQEVSSDSE
jgi:hypothetical protein